MPFPVIFVVLYRCSLHCYCFYYPSNQEGYYSDFGFLIDTCKARMQTGWVFSSLKVGHSSLEWYKTLPISLDTGCIHIQRLNSMCARKSFPAWECHIVYFFYSHYYKCHRDAIQPCYFDENKASSENLDKLYTRFRYI